jgi:D-alanine-D-alanine ligase
MLIGLTYDLRSDYLKEGFSEEETAEFDAEVTIDAVESTLNSLGYRTERIGNIKALVKAITQNKRWDLVFNICEGMFGIGREAQVPAILDAYQIPYVFSDPLVLSLTLHKGHTKRVVRDFGIPTADFAVVESIEDIESVNLQFPLFVKPVAEGTGKGIDSKSIVVSPYQLVESCERLLQKFKQPVLVETFLPGREFTVGIVGTGKNAKVVGVMEIVVTERATEQVYSYNTKENWHDIVEYPLATGQDFSLCEQIALRAWRVLDCRDGGRIDLKMDENGIPNFIEVNPLAGINPDHSDLPMLARKNGITYQQLMEMIMESAKERTGLNSVNQNKSTKKS